MNERWRELLFGDERRRSRVLQDSEGERYLEFPDETAPPPPFPGMAQPTVRVPIVRPGQNNLPPLEEPAPPAEEPVRFLEPPDAPAGPRFAERENQAARDAIRLGRTIARYESRTNPPLGRLEDDPGSGAIASQEESARQRVRETEQNRARYEARLARQRMEERMNAGRPSSQDIVFNLLFGPRRPSKRSPAAPEE